MGNKSVLLLFFVLFIHSFILAQDKKLEKYVAKNEVEKTIKRATKISKSKNQKQEMNYYFAWAYFQRFKNSNTEKDFKKSLNYVKKIKYDSTTKSYLSEKIKSIESEIIKRIEDETCTQKELNVYSQILDKTFNKGLNAKDEQHKSEYISTVSPLTFQDSIMLFTESLIGVPYKYGGEDTNGFDCSGFVKFVYKKTGRELPHNAHMMSKLGNEVSWEEAQIGDLVIFGYLTNGSYRASHAGILYEKNGVKSVIHCVNGGVKIAFDDWDQYWKDKVLFVKRIVE